MSETATRKRPPPEKVPQWWDHQMKHPMADADFKDALFLHILCTSEDRSLRSVRTRARKFVDYFCKQQIEQSLADYREEHPLD